jgi:hypothetical protein
MWKNERLSVVETPEHTKLKTTKRRPKDVRSIFFFSLLNLFLVAYTDSGDGLREELPGGEPLHGQADAGERAGLRAAHGRETEARGPVLRDRQEPRRLHALHAADPQLARPQE